jgi:hypothetical protein
MKRTWHQLAPAVPVQEVVDRAVAGRMPDRFLVARLEIMDVQHLASAGRFGKAREQGLYLPPTSCSRACARHSAWA